MKLFQLFAACEISQHACYIEYVCVHHVNTFGLSTAIAPDLDLRLSTAQEATIISAASIATVEPTCSFRSCKTAGDG